MRHKVYYIAAAALFGVAAFFFLGRPNVRSPLTQFEPEERTETGAVPSSFPKTAPSNPSVTDRDHKLLGELVEILVSKNDNDPRLDTDFRHLTIGTKQLLMEKYRNFPMEARNERGTIVFLIGRDLSRPEDCQFLASVTAEAPCLNLSDCKKAPSHSDEDVHEEAAISVTLAYPQHVALKSMEGFLGSKDSDPVLRDACLGALDKMTESPVGPIARKAEALRTQFRRN